jgi:hypothetical protein
MVEVAVVDDVEVEVAYVEEVAREATRTGRMCIGWWRQHSRDIVRKWVDVEISVVETAKDEACFRFVKPKNVSWMKLHNIVLPIPDTKVETITTIC